MTAPKKGATLLVDLLLGAVSADPEPGAAALEEPAGGVWRNAAPKDAGFPRVVFRTISTQSGKTMRGPDGKPRARVQLDVYATSPEEADEIGDLARERLDGYRGVVAGVPVDLIDEVDDEDDVEDPDDGGEGRIYRVRRDYMITAERSRPNPQD